MTIDELKDDVRDVWQLIDFCRDNDLYDFMSEYLNIYTGDEYNEKINYYIKDIANIYSWTEIRDNLNDLPDGGDDYYHKDDYGEWESVRDYLYDEFMEVLINYLRDDGFFEEDGDEDNTVSEEEKSECTAEDFYKGYLKHKPEDNGINILELYKEGK